MVNHLELDRDLAAIFTLLQEHELTSSNLVNQELSKIVALLLRDFISSWFKFISQDQEIYIEIIKAISAMIQEVERRCFRIDWVSLITQDLPTILSNHIKDHRSCCKKVGTAYSGGKSFEQLFYGLQSHIALASEESEREYVKRISEILLDAIIPESEVQSDAVRILLCEITSNSVLYNTIDQLSDPDFLNEMLLRLIDPNTYYSAQVEVSRMDYHSEASDNDLVESSTRNEPIEVNNYGKTQENDDTLFRLSKNKSSFLRRVRRKSDASNNPFTQNLNKITFGGFEKVSSGLDKLKGFVSYTSEPRRRKKKKNLSYQKGETSESDFDLSDMNPSPIGNVVPALQVMASESELDQNQKEEPMSSGREIPDAVEPVSFNEKNVLDEVQASQPKSIISFELINEILFGVWKLHRETIVGPWKLGPINANSYDRVRLEDSFLELFSEIFEFNYRQNWLYTQIHYFLKPVILAVGGHVINRAIIKSTFFLIKESSIVNYLELFRSSYWPNNQLAPPFVVRSESEKAEIRKMLENAIIKLISDSLSPMIRKQVIGEKIQYLIDVFQNKKINKHLLYIILDLMMMHLVPESATLRSN